MNKLYIGLMSGTSADSIDSALVDLSKNKCELLEKESTPINKKLKNKIFETINRKNINQNEIDILDLEMGKLFGKAVLDLLRKASVEANKIEAIGSHGQTIKHSPNKPKPYSLQIGNPKVITDLTKIKPVGDFRSDDIKAGGQGAPLAPLFHQFILQSNNLKRGVIVNIGGISNLTVVNNESEVFGYDCGPGNCLMDAWSRSHGKGDYDKAGAWASRGEFNLNLLKLMMEDSYFSAENPKSTGTDYFNLSWLNEKISKLNSIPSAEDVQATLSELSAQIIYHELKKLKKLSEQIFLCGGGVHNNFLIEKIQNKIKNETFTTASLGQDPDYLEACCFAWLAKKRLDRFEFDLSKITGSKKPICLGTIFEVPI